MPSDSMDAMAENGYDPADDAPTPDVSMLKKESAETLSRAIDSLPEDMRTVVILYAFEQLRYEDIAQITNVSVGTVKSRLNRARAKLLAFVRENQEQNANFSVKQDEGGTEK